MWNPNMEHKCDILIQKVDPYLGTFFTNMERVPNVKCGLKFPLLMPLYPHSHPSEVSFCVPAQQSPCCLSQCDKKNVNKVSKNYLLNFEFSEVFKVLDIVITRLFGC